MAKLKQMNMICNKDNLALCLSVKDMFHGKELMKLLYIYSNIARWR